MLKKIVVGAVLLVVLAGAVFYTNPFGVFGEKIYASVPGNQAPAISAVDINGVATDVQFQGGLTVLNFWATWCPPCKAEMPEFESFYRDNAGKIAFYAINIQEPPERVKSFLKAEQYTMPILLDSNGEIAKSYRVNAIPTTIIVDKTGKVVFRKSGAMSKEELDKAVALFRQ